MENESSKRVVDNDLTTVEWKIYNFLKERSEQEIWTKQIDIQDFLQSININCGLRQCRRYVFNIRKSSVIQKIILSDYSKGYKLMNSEEEFDYLERKKISLLKKLKQYYKDVERFNRNNQVKITFGEYERDFFESILKKENSVK